MKKRLSIRVVGNVQGVFFRHATHKYACENSLTGFVRNEPDGSVYIEAEGDSLALQQFVEWCNHGPPHAKVQRVEVHKARPAYFTNFTIQ